MLVDPQLSQRSAGIEDLEKAILKYATRIDNTMGD